MATYIDTHQLTEELPTELSGFSNPKAKKSDKTDLLAEKVFAYVVENIRRGSFGPNQKITQRALAAQLEISPIPVREALEKLYHHGWIERSPNKGCRVKAFDKKDIHEIYQAREMIEAEAVILLAENITPEQLSELKKVVDILENSCQNNDVETYDAADTQFHRLLIHFTENKRIQNFYESILMQAHCFISIGALKAAFYWRESPEEVEPHSHKRIYEALAAHDVNLAEDLIRNAIRTSCEMVMMIMDSRESLLNHDK